MSLSPARRIPGITWRLLHCAAVLAGLAAAPAPGQAQQPPAQPTPSPAPMLSYVSDTVPERQRDLYVMRLDGTDKKQLTQGIKVWFASWSPDGRQIAVSSEAGELYIINPETAERWPRRPAVSPSSAVAPVQAITISEWIPMNERGPQAPGGSD